MADLERGEIQKDSGARESPEYILVHIAGEEELTLGVGQPRTSAQLPIPRIASTPKLPRLHPTK